MITATSDSRVSTHPELGHVHSTATNDMGQCLDINKLPMAQSKVKYPLPKIVEFPAAKLFRDDK